MRILKKTLSVILSTMILLSMLTLSMAGVSADTDTENEVMIGDVNGDQQVDLNDVLLVQKSVAALITLEGGAEIAADTNGDDLVDLNDVLLLQKFVAKLIDTFPETNANTEREWATELFYLGHSSLMITSKDGVVIYIDPYAGTDYSLPADIILVTHQHYDHNNVSLVTQKEDCTTITNAEALEGGKYNSFSVKGIEIESVFAENANHSSLSCVGYIITVDGVKIYMAGDTSKTEQMETFAEKELDYALLPCDGIYNMGVEEAAQCAEIIGAKHNIPIHTRPGKLFDKNVAEAFDAPNRLIVEPGQTIALEK